MAQILIGTPATIKTLIGFKKLALTKLKILVFDDADQLLAEVHISHANYMLFYYSYIQAQQPYIFYCWRITYTPIRLLNS
jgi:hypothetical protein